MEVYVPMCEQFHAMASTAYSQYKHEETHGNEYSLEVPAICAVVFEALAIEAYVNFFGVYTLGNKEYYAEYERLPTKEKIKKLCKEKGRMQYPTDTAHFQTLEHLVKKRNDLVHSKPMPHVLELKPFDYDRPKESFEDYIDIFSEITFVYEHIDEEMKLYEEIKANLTNCFGLKEEPLQSYHKAEQTALAKAIAKTCMIGFSQSAEQKSTE